MIATINCLANLVTFVTMTIFYIYLYGDDSKVVYKWKFVGHWTLKVGIVVMTSGKFLSVLHCQPVAWYEAVMNIGLAMIFIWTATFHKKMFKNARPKNA